MAAEGEGEEREREEEEDRREMAALHLRRCCRRDPAAISRRGGVAGAADAASEVRWGRKVGDGGTHSWEDVILVGCAGSPTGMRVPGSDGVDVSVCSWLALWRWLLVWLRCTL